MGGLSRSGARCLGRAILLLVLVGRPALAGWLPSYSVTDLGPGATSFATDASGQQLVTTHDGTTAYAFPQIQYASAAATQAALASIPPMTNAPVSSTNGNPGNAYSELSNAFLNEKGQMVVTNVGAGSTVFSALPQADGSYKLADALWSTPNNASSGGVVAQAIALNNQGLVLGMSGYIPVYGPLEVLYNLATGQSVDVMSLLPATWRQGFARALDDQGRILVMASEMPTPGSPGDSVYHSFLLTPAGLPVDPIPIPEPTTLATLVLGLGVLAYHRRRLTS